MFHWKNYTRNKLSIVIKVRNKKSTKVLERIITHLKPHHIVVTNTHHIIVVTKKVTTILHYYLQSTNIRI